MNKTLVSMEVYALSKSQFKPMDIFVSTNKTTHVRVSNYLILTHALKKMYNMLSHTSASEPIDPSNKHVHRHKHVQQSNQIVDWMIFECVYRWSVRLLFAYVRVRRLAINGSRSLLCAWLPIPSRVLCRGNADI